MYSSFLPTEKKNQKKLLLSNLTGIEDLHENQLRTTCNVDSTLNIIIYLLVLSHITVLTVVNRIQLSLPNPLIANRGALKDPCSTSSLIFRFIYLN